MIGRIPTVRAVAIATAVAGAVAVSAGGATRPTRIVVHVNGVQTGDYVTETSASGLHFLVPAGVLADQGLSTFQVAVPRVASGSLGPGPAGAGPWGTQLIATAVVPPLATVEILATGSPGVTFSVGWEDTCGGTRQGKHGVAGGTGGQGRSDLRSPAVVVVKLPPSTGDYSGCYLDASAWARTRSALRLQIIDY
jgi:hypothetical protein